jgi:SAM-dependent methyltransferase
VHLASLFRLTFIPTRAAPKGEVRTAEELRQHYVIERGLADRLRNAPAAARRQLYHEVYDELLRRVPHHPMLRARFDAHEQDRRARAVEQQLAFLNRFFTPRTIFMEIGAGDCAVSLGAAGYVERVYSIEVSEEIVSTVRSPSNMKLVLSDGLAIPVPEETVNVAFSDQLMEHLHPDDAREQLQNIYRCLAPGGMYVCVTPSKLYGPRDISAGFDEEATGLHLREYSARELRTMLHQVGFRKVSFYAGARGTFMRVPYALIAFAESVLGRLPYRIRKLLADNAPMRALLGVRVGATK